MPGEDYFNHGWKHEYFIHRKLLLCLTCAVNKSGGPESNLLDFLDTRQHSEYIKHAKLSMYLHDDNSFVLEKEE